MTAPRSGDDLLAEALGVSSRYAKQLRRRFAPSGRFEAMDAQMRSEAAVADLEAARSLDDEDLSDFAEADDPQAEMREVLDERADRILRAKLAAHASWAKTDDRAARTAKAREAMWRKFEAEVDPEGKLSPQERAIRAEHARKAFYLRLSLKSAQARRARKAR